MEEGIQEELVCPMCSTLYEEEQCEPVTLPRCGHTFCRSCLADYAPRGHFPCPNCRKRHIRPSVPQLPVNLDVLALAEVFRDDKVGRCAMHGEVLEYWCRECQRSLCGDCPVRCGHDVARSRLVLNEKKQELEEQGHLVLQSVQNEKQKIMDKVKSCSLLLLRTCEESNLTTCSVQDVQHMLGDTKKTADIPSILTYLQRMNSILAKFRSTPREDGEKETKGRKLEDGEKEAKGRRRRGLSTTRPQDTTAQDTTSPTALRRKTETTTKTRPSAPNTVVVNKPNTLSPKTPNTPSNKSPNTPSNKTPNTPSNKTPSTPSPTSPSPMTDGDMVAPGLALLEAGLWPLSCCAYSGDGRRAQLKWEKKRLHMYALSNHLEDAHFMIKLSVVLALVPQESPEVFMDFAAGEKRLGRVYIKLWGHLRRAHNFLAMCTGSHGPSYRGARFQEVYAKGLAGECLHAGEYLMPDGSLSAAGVIDNLEWDGKVKKPQKVGRVVGAGSGRPERDSCFDICTIENQDRNFACPFGEVVAGWDVVLEAVKHKPVRGVFMQEVGVVLPEFSQRN